MLRPIDTQTIYQQSPEMSNRIQAQLQGETAQQAQFAHLLQKETEQNKEIVIEIKKDEQIDNTLDKNRSKNRNGQGQKNRQEKGKKINSKEKVSNGSTGHFDARI